MQNCPFCNDAVRNSVFLSDDGFLALYNIAPVLPGHSLVIPEKHLISLFDLTGPEITRMFETARKALRVLMTAFSTDAFDLSLQEKPEAGQTIEHLHLHIVPRMKNDLKSPGDWYPMVADNDNAMIDSFSRPRLNDEAMSQIVTELRKVTASLF